MGDPKGVDVTKVDVTLDVTRTLYWTMITNRPTQTAMARDAREAGIALLSQLPHSLSP
jgi:hypothetical protein